jgi:hypothetical protein
MKQKEKNPTEQEIIEGLKALKEIPAREPANVNYSKNTYLAEVAETLSSVSARQEERHTGWIANLFMRKEPLRMSTLGTIILAISLILGVVESQPYQLKTAYPTASSIR